MSNDKGMSSVYWRQHFISSTARFITPHLNSGTWRASPGPWSLNRRKNEKRTIELRTSRYDIHTAEECFRLEPPGRSHSCGRSGPVFDREWSTRAGTIIH